jgi:hypothetical protein
MTSCQNVAHRGTVYYMEPSNTKRSIVGIEFPPALLARLRAAAVADERSLGWVVRTACAAWLESRAATALPGNPGQPLQAATVAPSSLLPRKAARHPSRTLWTRLPP